MKKYEGLVQDEEGDKVSQATITVNDYVGGANSTIYGSDVAGSSGPNINGFTNESDGTFSFYATDGYYNIEISKPGLTTKTISNVHIKDTEAIISAKGYLTLQAAYDANPGKRIYCPEGYYGTVVATAHSTRISGAGPGRTIIINSSLTGHAVKFYPNSTVVGTFINFCEIDNLTIYSGVDKTAGAGVYCLQCNGFRMDNVQIQNHPEGLLVSGGQLNIFRNTTVFASSSILTGAPVANSQAIRLCEAPMDGGAYQECFTCEFTNTIIAGSRVLDKLVRIESADGLHFTNGYWGGEYSDTVYIACVTASRYIAGVVFNSIYLDGIGMASGPTNRNGINIPSSAVGNVYDIIFNSGTIGNYTGKGCIVGENMQQLTFSGGTKFVNIDNWAIDFVGGNTTSELTVTGCHFRDVGEVTINKGAISASTFLNAVITSNTFTNIGNTGATAVLLSGTNANVCVGNNTYSGCTTNLTNSATFTGKVEGVPVSFTPTINFITPGDFAATYSTQVGQWERHGNRVYVDVQIVTSSFTHTTAALQMFVGTVPTVQTLTGYRPIGVLRFQGITKAGYTQFYPLIGSAGTGVTFAASASGSALSDVVAADVPTGGSVILNFSINYEVAA